MVARTITVNEQMLRGHVGTPKGRTRRTIPMTTTLYEALKAIPAVREGYVILDHIGLGNYKHQENAIKRLMERICRKAGLPQSGWHRLRHSFGTQAALFGVNPWHLQGWMGHKKIDETMRYVHVNTVHHRDLPPVMLAARQGETDLSRQVLAMLDSRSRLPWQPRGSESVASLENGETNAA